MLCHTRDIISVFHTPTCAKPRGASSPDRSIHHQPRLKEGKERANGADFLSVTLASNTNLRRELRRGLEENSRSIYMYSNKYLSRKTTDQRAAKRSRPPNVHTKFPNPNQEYAANRTERETGQPQRIACNKTQQTERTPLAAKLPPQPTCSGVIDKKTKVLLVLLLPLHT